MNHKLSETAVKARFFSQTAPIASGSAFKLWKYTKEDLGQIPKFDCGVFALSPDSQSNLLVGLDLATERKLERLFVVARGSAICKHGETKIELENSDCVYLPPGADCTVENTGGTELVLGWASSFLAYDSQRESVQVIKTLKEVTPVTLTIKGLEREIYRIKQTKGFHFAVFRRGAHTYSPLHTHDPPYFEEAFIVLGGKLWVTGLDGQTNGLSDFDFAYVPPYGGNLNENKSGEGVTYAWIGAPAVNMKEIPVEKQYSKYYDKMSLDKPN